MDPSIMPGAAPIPSKRDSPPQRIYSQNKESRFTVTE